LICFKIDGRFAIEGQFSEFQHMSETKTVTLIDGRQVGVTEVVPGPFQASAPTILEYQFVGSSGSGSTTPQVLDQDQTDLTQTPVGHVLLPLYFDAQAFTGGGFEVVYDVRTVDSEGVDRFVLKGVAVGADGSIVSNLGAQLDFPTLPISNAQPAPPSVATLPGDRFVVAFETFDANNAPTSHVDLATASGGVYADVAVSSRPDAITHDAGDITLTWNSSGVAEREVLGLNGVVLADRAVSKVFTLGVAGNTNLEESDFNPAHDQIRLVNADGSPAGGVASTLTYDERSHSLTWDPDSQGPAPATQVADFVDAKGASPDGLPFNVAELADGFRPAVLKVILPGGSSDITWFDTTNSQPWDTLHAQEDAQGDVLTYSSTSDNGTQELFTFDVTNTQAYQRYVDEIDVGGHVTQRTVLYDDGTSWTAKFAFSGGQVTSYEVDNFNAAGVLVGKGFFHADGTPI
jgi:hypothetical protein